MSPRKSSKKKASKAKAKKAKPTKAKSKKAKSARRARPAGKKAGRKKVTARRGGQSRKGRASVPVVFRRKGGEAAAADTVDTLGEWQNDHEVDTEKYTEDDIPPDYGGSE